MILNAFSLNLVPAEIIHKLRIAPVTTDEIKNAYCGGEAINSFVGHENTAVVMENVLNETGSKSVFIPIKANRQTVRLTESDTAFIGQYCGARLEEGATKLPEGAEIKWFKAWFPKPSVRIVTGADSKFDFAAAYAAALDGLYDGESVGSVSFTARRANGRGEYLVCTIVTAA